MKYVFLSLSLWLSSTTVYAQSYDVIITGGMIYDGSGGAPVKADLGINKAFEWLEKDFQDRDGRLYNIRWETAFEPLWNEPRLKAC